MITRESPEIAAARRFTRQAASLLEQTASFQHLDAKSRAALVRDLSVIQQAFGAEPSTEVASPIPNPQRPFARPRTRQAVTSPQITAGTDPYALSLATPNDLRRRRSQFGPGQPVAEEEPANDMAPETGNQDVTGPRKAATETIAARAGALSDELDFPAFVASLVHGTFDAMVDASIRQMEAFAELVSAVAKDVDRFTQENITPNQVRDWLASQHPRDLVVDVPASGTPRLHRRPNEASEGEDSSPPWLVDYDLEGEELSDELIEEQLIPQARRRLGEHRLQMLATMVLMGMNRIVIRDGSISAKLRFRAGARDKASVDFAVSQDPGGAGWGGRGSKAYSDSSLMVSTVGVNVQTDAELKAELFGEVRINFASETLPLERFVDAAQMALLQRNARTGATQPAIPARTTPIIEPVPAVPQPAEPASPGITPAPSENP